MKVKVISNTCVASEIYLRARLTYTTPFVGSIFLDDTMYLNFLKKYEHYINLEPKFDIVDQSNYLPGLKNIYPKYPLMKLDDIEIHWIHEDKPEVVLEKWKRRMERGKDLEPVFTWSASEFMSPKDGEIREKFINEFCELPYFSIFLTERPKEQKDGNNFVIRYIESFQDKEQNDRMQWHFLRWNNQYAISIVIKNVLTEKNMSI